MMTALFLVLHVLAAVVWVGGMFFAHMVARPSLLTVDPPVRLSLWAEILPRFFAWVWWAVPIVLASGYGALFFRYGDISAAPWPIHLMQGIGWIMAGIFVYLYRVPFGRFRRAVAARAWSDAAAHQAVIRRLVTVNLTLGLAVSALAAANPLWR